jgi:hypothetical protein
MLHRHFSAHISSHEWDLGEAKVRLEAKNYLPESYIDSVLASFLSEEEKQLSIMVNGTIYLARPIVCPPLVQGSAAWLVGLKASALAHWAVRSFVQ